MVEVVVMRDQSAVMNVGAGQHVLKIIRSTVAHDADRVGVGGQNGEMLVDWRGQPSLGDSSRKMKSRQRRMRECRTW